MEEIVGRDGVFHDVKVGRTLQEMLALSTRVLGPNLLAVNTLDRETLATS